MCYTIVRIQLFPNALGIIEKEGTYMNSLNFVSDLKDLLNGPNVHTQWSVPQLVEAATSRGEAVLTREGAVKAETGK